MPAFPFNVYLLAFLGALAGSALSLPAWRRWCLRSGHVDDPGHRKIHDRVVPLAGGLAVATGILLPLIFSGLALAAGSLATATGHDTHGVIHPLDPQTAELVAYGFSRRGLQLTVLCLGALGMLALGIIDDRRELSPGGKFLGQFLLAALVAASGTRITLFVSSPLFSFLVTILWILTVTNACNFMDNMNGLCTGLAIIGTWCFAWTAAVQGQFLVASTGFLAAGALLGFLPFNFPKASAFLGDAGSHLAGYLLAVLAILPHFHSITQPAPWAVLKPLLVLGVILGDLVCIVWIRWRLHKPFYIGDTNHLSHRLVRRGLSRTTAVLLILLAAAALSALSFAL